MVHKLRHANDLKDRVQQPFGTIEGLTVEYPKNILDKHVEDGSDVEIEMI